MTILSGNHQWGESVVVRCIDDCATICVVNDNFVASRFEGPVGGCASPRDLRADVANNVDVTSMLPAIIGSLVVTPVPWFIEVAS